MVLTRSQRRAATIRMLEERHALIARDKERRAFLDKVPARNQRLPRRASVLTRAQHRAAVARNTAMLDARIVKLHRLLAFIRHTHISWRQYRNVTHRPLGGVSAAKAKARAAARVKERKEREEKAKALKIPRWKPHEQTRSALFAI